MTPEKAQPRSLPTKTRAGSGTKSTAKTGKPKITAKTKSSAKRQKPVELPKAAHLKPAHEVTRPAEVAAKNPSVALSHKPKIALEKYYFATGRRKTAVANVRLFEGTGELVVNRKPFTKYFFHAELQASALKPLELLGLAKTHHFTVQINGGGIKAQAQALQHGLAQAISVMNQELRKQLKKAGFLTRDDRKKERKKPGLKRARRSPQWAKR